MSYELSWYIDRRIVLARLTGDVSAEEIFQNNQRIARDYVQQGQAPVHLLIDISGMEKFPSNLKQLKAASDILLREHSLGWMVTVGKVNTLERFLTSTLTQMFGVRLHMTDTLARALAFLSKNDVSIPEMSKDPLP